MAADASGSLPTLFLSAALATPTAQRGLLGGDNRALGEKNLKLLRFVIHKQTRLVCHETSVDV